MDPNWRFGAHVVGFRPSVRVLVIANLLPLAGVLLAGWSLFPLMFRRFSLNRYEAIHDNN